MLGISCQSKNYNSIDKQFEIIDIKLVSDIILMNYFYRKYSLLHIKYSNRYRKIIKAKGNNKCQIKLKVMLDIIEK